MKEGNVIDCEAPRDPFRTLDSATRQGLIDIAKRLDPIVLRWGR
jgi:2-keto-3-deoxy-L-arabinonate dehydratase